MQALLRFCSRFFLGVEKITPQVLIIYWSELFLKVWANSGIVEFFSWFGEGVPPFLQNDEIFCLVAGQIFNFNLDLGLRKTFTFTLNYLLLWAHPESVNQMEHGWVFFADVGKVSPHLLPKVSTEGWEKIHLKSWSFMDHSLSWKFEPSQTWLSFFLWMWGNFPLFWKN